MINPRLIQPGARVANRHGVVFTVDSVYFAGVTGPPRASVMLVDPHGYRHTVHFNVFAEHFRPERPNNQEPQMENDETNETLKHLHDAVGKGATLREVPAGILKQAGEAAEGMSRLCKVLDLPQTATAPQVVAAVEQALEGVEERDALLREIRAAVGVDEYKAPEQLPDMIRAAIRVGAPGKMHTDILDEIEERRALAFKLVEILRIGAFERSSASGFWNGVDPYNVNVQLAKLALIVSECGGEAVEAVRDGYELSSKKIPGHTQLAEELADTIIRIADLCGALGIDLPSAIIAKHEHNASRQKMHGRLA